MQSFPVLPSAAVDRATDQLIAVGAVVNAAARREAEDLVRRLTPELWPLEWQLPFWLGRDFALAEAVWQQLVTINLLGAGYVRLTDDLADELLAPARQAVKAALGQRLLAASSELLLALFQRESPFWGRYATYLDQWRRAGASQETGRDWPSERLLDDWRWLAWRGAPAKITATGACLLAGRDGLIGALETCIDHVMVATVLLDHADDWQEDLAAGHFNAYVAWLSGAPQHAANAGRHRQAVLSALMQGDGAGQRAYFGLIDGQLVEAQRIASQVGSGGLGAYIAAFRHSAQVQGAGQLAAARQRLQDALASLLAGVDDS